MAAQAPREHPRLLFAAADVPAMRARVAAGGVPGVAWQRLRTKAAGIMLRVTPELVRAGVPYTQQNEFNTYLIELGLAYQLSGDPSYGRRVVDLLSAIGDAGYPFWSGQDLGIGDLLEGIGLGFDWSYELMTEAEREKIVGQLTASEDLLFDRTLLHPTNDSSTYPTSNWMGVTGGGAGLALLAIAGEPRLPDAFSTYLETALTKVRTYLAAGVDPRGAAHEGFVYAGYGLKNSVPFAIAARRAGYGDLMAGTGLANMARWIAFEQLPGEGQTYAPLNDSNRSVPGVDLITMQFAIAPANGIAQWLFNRTVGPLGTDCYGLVQNPTCDLPIVHGNVWTILYYRTPTETPEVDPASVGPRSIHHAQRGLVDARTGFAGGRGEVLSTFEAHRDGIGHFQFDIGSFTLYGLGGQWAIDPGYACLACGDTNEAGYATAHNVIVVDGSQFTQYVYSRYFTGTTIDDFVDSPNASLTHADLRYAYGEIPDIPRAGRDHFFSRVPGRPVLLAIADELTRAEIGTHAYTWQMLTALGNVAVPSGSGFSITAPSGARLAARSAVDGDPAHDPAFGLAVKLLTNPNGEGAAQILSTTTGQQSTLDQLAVLALTPPGRASATTRTLRVTGGNAIETTWEGVSDVVVRRLHDTGAVSGPVATDGTFAKHTRGAGETVLRDGVRLAADGRDYVTVTGTNATTIVGGDQASGVGDTANRYRVFAPQTINTARVNGSSVAWCREQQEIVFPCAGGHAEPLPTHLTAEPALLQTRPLRVPLFSLAATLSRSDSGRPMSDKTVSFSAGVTPLCTAVTNEQGRASCSGLGGALQILFNGGYSASFAGTPDLAPTSAIGSIAG